MNPSGNGEEARLELLGVFPITSKDAGGRHLTTVDTVET